MSRLAPALVLALVAALPAQADQWDRLRNDPGISEGLVNFAIARDIQSRCPTISARRMRAIGFITELVGDAMELGYRRSEIREFVFNEAEQERVGALADERMAARGVAPDMIEGYCAVGREEIAAGSTIGRLLR